MDIKSTLIEIKNKYQGINPIAVYFEGARGVFGEFSDAYARNKDNGRELGDFNADDFIKTYHELLLYIIKRAGTSFYPDGSEGAIILDLEKPEIRVVCKHFVKTTIEMDALEIG